MSKTQNKWSFRKGYDQLMYKDRNKVRSEIMEILGLSTPQSFYLRLSGKIVSKLNEAEAIEAVFAKYSITEVWGEK